MKHTLLPFILLLVISVKSFSQLNKDSLKAELKKYTPVKHNNDFNAYTIRYLDKNKLIIYAISYNAKGEIDADFWGIAITHKKYDALGRCIEGRYYDINGKLHFSDWPPIDKTQYDAHNNKTIIDYFGEDEKQTNRFEYVYDSEGRIIEFKMFNKDLQIVHITQYEFKENGKVVLEKSFTGDNKIISDANGVAIYYKSYENEKREKIIEKRYLDIDGKLVLKKDQPSTIGYAIEIYIYELKKNWIKIEYFNQENIKVAEKWEWDSPLKK